MPSREYAAPYTLGEKRLEGWYCVLSSGLLKLDEQGGGGEGGSEAVQQMMFLRVLVNTHYNIRQLCVVHVSMSQLLQQISNLVLNSVYHCRTVLQMYEEWNSYKAILLVKNYFPQVLVNEDPWSL